MSGSDSDYEPASSPASRRKADAKRKRDRRQQLSPEARRPELDSQAQRQRDRRQQLSPEARLAELDSQAQRQRRTRAAAAAAVNVQVAAQQWPPAPPHADYTLADLRSRFCHGLLPRSFQPTWELSDEEKLLLPYLREDRLQVRKPVEQPPLGCEWTGQVQIALRHCPPDCCPSTWTDWVEAFQNKWLLAIPFLSGPRKWMNELEADRQSDPHLWAGTSPPTQPGDKRWVLYSKRGDRMSTVCPKAFDTCVFGTLVVMPGFFKRWPKTHWHFEMVAPGGYLGVGNEADGTWLELESLL